MTDHTLIQISHYQKKLEKYVATGEDEKLLYCIHKLKYLPVTVSHLEKTGVGKSINGLRHKNGVIGEKARTLVQKWKLMVSKEEEQQQEEESQMEYEPDITSLQNKYCSQSNTPQAVNEEEYDPSDEGDRLQIQEQDEDEGEQNLTYNPGGHSIENEEENFNGYNPKTSREDYLSIGSQSHIDYNPSVNPSHKHSSEESKPTSPEMSSLPNGDAHKESHHGDPQGDSHEDNTKKDKSHKSREESKHKKKKHKSKHDSEEKHQSSEHRKSKHKSSKSKDKKRDREKESIKESNKHSPHSSSSKSKSHSSSHHKNKSLTDSSSPVNSSSQANSCSSSNPSNSLSSSDLKRHRDPEDQPEDPSSKKSKIIEKQKDKKSHKSSKSSKDDHKLSKKKKENVSIEAPSEFEAALMGMDSTPSKKKKKKSKEKEEKKEILENESPSCSPSSSKLKELDLGYREQLPDLPSSFELETSAAPQLMTHYKPLPHVPQRSSSYKDPLNNMTNEEALNYMFTSKSNKQRRIYAGKASGMFSVPSLMDICMRVLQENIDAIETTGGIPYSILKPMLERATAQQLFSLEDYNPYFLEDTDPLWSAHCRKSFKNKQREDMETWREMFIRCTDENQEKMRSVTESLQKKYITKAIPKRMTQLAYVNTAAKPPKSVARAQARYGTASASAPPVKIFSKAAEPQSIASTSNSTANGSSSSSGSSSNVVPKPEKPFPNKPSAVKKPKVAPLMGKARQLMKKVCRR